MDRVANRLPYRLFVGLAPPSPRVNAEQLETEMRVVMIDDANAVPPSVRRAVSSRYGPNRGRA